MLKFTLIITSNSSLPFTLFSRGNYCSDYRYIFADTYRYIRAHGKYVVTFYMFPINGNNMQYITQIYSFTQYFFDVSMLTLGDLVHFFPLNLVFHCMNILHFISLISFGGQLNCFPSFAIYKQLCNEHLFTHPLFTCLDFSLG